VSRALLYGKSVAASGVEEEDQDDDADGSCLVIIKGATSYKGLAKAQNQLQNLEACIEGLEYELESLFRSLIEEQGRQSPGLYQFVRRRTCKFVFVMIAIRVFKGRFIIRVPQI
jgi:hypothetical protein